MKNRTYRLYVRNFFPLSQISTCRVQLRVKSTFYLPFRTIAIILLLPVVQKYYVRKRRGTSYATMRFELPRNYCTINRLARRFPRVATVTRKNCVSTIVRSFKSRAQPQICEYSVSIIHSIRVDRYSVKLLFVKQHLLRYISRLLMCVINNEYYNGLQRLGTGWLIYS